jgi:cell division protease FtsH
MSEGLGQRTFGDKEQGFVFEHSQNDYSEETSAAIDREVKTLTGGCYDAVKLLLNEKRELLTRLKDELKAKETLGPAELLAILGPRPATA